MGQHAVRAYKTIERKNLVGNARTGKNASCAFQRIALPKHFLA